MRQIKIINYIAGPTVQFRLEEPAIMAFAQAKRVNLPLVISHLFLLHDNFYVTYLEESQ
jgi:hypothetical protein